MIEKKAPTIKRPIITLITDFGSADHYVGAMKGVICELNPHAKIVDITHDIPPHDLMTAAFVLRGAFLHFPLNTIHVVVVDPGKGGSKCRPIMVRSDNYYFFGPDNGVFSFVYDVEGVSRVFELQAVHYFQQPVSVNFHGRDIYAPCAAYLSRNFQGDDFGEQIQDYQRINTPKPQAAEKQVKGHILHVDRFGNLISNVTLADLQRFMQKVGSKRFVVTVGGKQVGAHAASYAAGTAEVFTVSGSHGFLEVAAQQKSAAKLLGASRGQELVVQLE